MATVLVVMADQAECDLLVDLAEQRGFSSHCLDRPEKIGRSAPRIKANLVFLDARLLDHCIDSLLDLPGAAFDRLIFVVDDPLWIERISSLASRRIRAIARPISEPEVRAILSEVGRTAVRRLRKRIQSRPGFGLLLGDSPQMCEIYGLLAKVAPTDSTVLIQGESGTGKELVAQTLHERSERRGHRFVAINCGAIPENLIESELFGHEKGAFTGAERPRQGVFERAHRGTLFLDEITEMPADMQVRLLRVLENGTVTRVGGEKEMTVDVRVIAATNRDPAHAVADGKLREDLYYRLAVFPMRLPPLRERGDDAILLANQFLADHNRKGRTAKKLTPLAESRIEEYHWPGNIRQLRNTIEHAYIVEGDEIDLDTLSTLIRAKPLDEQAGAAPAAPAPYAPPAPSPATPVASSEHAATPSAPTSPIESPAPPQSPAVNPAADPAVGQSIADAERTLIFKTLDAVAGNKTQAAKLLGISLKTLYNRLKEYQEADGSPSSEIHAEPTDDDAADRGDVVVVPDSLHRLGSGTDGHDQR